MAIVVDDTTVIRWAANNQTGTAVLSALFTPANSSLLVVGVNSDEPAGGASPVTMAISGGGLIWTERIKKQSSGSAGTEGYAGIWTAPVTTGAQMQISLSHSAPAATPLQMSAKCYIATGQNAAPIGTTGSGSGTTNNLSPTLFAATGAGRAFYVGDDWSERGVPASTDVADAADYAGAVSVESVYKAADHANGDTLIGNLDAAGTLSAQWNWVALEVLAATTGDTLIGQACL